MSNSIRLITSPDIVFNQTDKILVICPGTELRSKLEEYIDNIVTPTDLYFYTGESDDVKWLLTVANIADTVIIDIDHITSDVANFLSYILSIPTTYYKCQHTVAPWDLLNQNRFYDFPNITREYNERQSEQ